MNSSDDQLLCSFLNQTLHPGNAHTPIVLDLFPSESWVAVAPPPSLVEPTAGDDAATQPSGSSGAKTEKARRLHFFDLRSQAAALANFARGGGTEVPNMYDRATMTFANLANIHGVREAFERLAKLCQVLQTPHLDCPTSKTPHYGFLAKLDSTGWPAMTQRLLWASWKVATLIAQDDDSVLVHCTDGWDRTAQVVSLSMILLDPYYRTIEGFCRLIMREWLEMGHRFADRCFHDRADDRDPTTAEMFGPEEAVGNDDEESDPVPQAGVFTAVTNATVGAMKTSTPPLQRAPVFVQFLDAVYQLLRMFPSKFEFTPRFLLYLTDQVYGCRFGTFLFNTHRSRYRRACVTTTASCWGEVQQLVHAERQDECTVLPGDRFLNPFFVPVESSKHNSDVLFPSFQSNRYQFWSACYFRYHDDGHPNVFGLELDPVTPFIEVFLLIRKQTAERSDEHKEAPQRLFLPYGDLSSVLQPLSAATASLPEEDSTTVSSPVQGNNLVTSFGAASQTRVARSFVPRSEATSCELCGETFRLFTRRHTCRRCCRAACHACSSHQIVLPRHEIQLYEERDATGPVRVCDHCYALCSIR